MIILVKILFRLVSKIVRVVNNRSIIMFKLNDIKLINQRDCKTRNYFRFLKKRNQFRILFY